MRRRLSRLTARDWRVIDRALAACVLATALLESLLSSNVDHRAATAALYGAMSLLLLVRRSHPFVVLLGTLAGCALGAELATAPPDMFVAIVLILTASYSAGAHLEGRRALLAFALAFGGIVVIAAMYDPNDVIFPAVFFSALPWLAGRTLRNHTALARELAEKAERAAHAREQDERRAIAAERSRIARELHDVLAHNLSVMVVQASAAGRIVDRDPGRAADTAQLIQRTGREALAELRHLFGPVRRGEVEELSGPPSIARVEQLAARARAAGLPVRVHVQGEPVALPPGVDLTAYRVVQEALTNALKHAGKAHARVTIVYEPGELVLSVEDDGDRDGLHEQLADAGGGHGLVGMRERVALYGGVLEAGRRRGGGFAVRARIPTRQPTASQVVAG